MKKYFYKIIFFKCSHVVILCNLISSDEQERGRVEGDDAVEVDRHRDVRCCAPPTWICNLGFVQAEAAGDEEPLVRLRVGEGGDGPELAGHAHGTAVLPAALELVLKSGTQTC